MIPFALIDSSGDDERGSLLDRLLALGTFVAFALIGCVAVGVVARACFEAFTLGWRVLS